MAAINKQRNNSVTKYFSLRVLAFSCWMLRSTAVLLKYTESGGAKVGVSFYWTCPKQETGASVWAKKASVLIIGRL